MTPIKQLESRSKFRRHDCHHRQPRPVVEVKPIASSGLNLRCIPLGGCGEVTRSCYIYEYKDDIVIVDMGLQFPEEDMPGIDYIIPNVDYLRPKKKNIRGIIVTHGHLDHIGAIPHLLEPLGYPTIFTMPLTRGMILKRQEDFKG